MRTPTLTFLLAITPVTLMPLAGCGDDTGGTDMTTAQPDLAQAAQPDLTQAAQPDLTQAAQPDLKPTADLVVSPDLAPSCPNPAPTLTQVKADVLASCASGCHNATNKRGGLDLQTDAHAAMVNAATVNATAKGTYPTRVVPSMSSKSYFYLKVAMTGPSDPVLGNRMPGGGAPALPQASLDKLRCWIDAGAKND